MSAGRKIVIEFLGKPDKALKAADQVEGKFGKLGGKLERVGNVAGKILAGGLLAGGAMMIKFGNQASDLAETQSKVNQIFGKDSVAALDKFAEKAAKTMGQSKQQALDGLATFGMFGKIAGKSGDDLVGFSSKMSKLSSDMASFSNTSPQESIEALGAALRGEAEPIRKYGVLLDDSVLKAEALAMGIVKPVKDQAKIKTAYANLTVNQQKYNDAVKKFGKNSIEAVTAQAHLGASQSSLKKATEGTMKPLTAQQKVLAAQSSIIKQTKDQQGDFARTSNGLANKQRILKAQLANVSTELGAKALPAMIKVTDAGMKMLNWTQKHSKLAGVLVGILGGLVAVTWAVGAAMSAWAAATALWTGISIVARNAQMAWNLAMMANPIGLVILALVALGAIFVVLYKKSDKFRAIVQGAFRGVQKAASAAWNWIKGNWPKLLAIITGPIGLATLFVVRHWKQIKDGASNAVRWVKDKFGDLVGFVRGLPGKIGHAASGMFNGIKNAFRSAINWIIDKWNNLQFSIPGVKIAGKTVFGGFTLGTPNIPRLEHGGTLRSAGDVIVADRNGRGGERISLPKGAQVTPLKGGGEVVHRFEIDLKLNGKTVQTLLLKEKRTTGRDLGIA